MARIRFACLIIAVLCAGLSACSPLVISRRAAPLRIDPRQNDNNQTNCVIEGNPDFYGLGIRVGIYLQWITALIANLCAKDSIDGSLETNTIFLLALYVAIAVATATEGQAQSAELIVLLQLGFGFLFSILSIWGHRTRTRKGDVPIRFPLLGAFFRLALATALSGYGLWFWFVGLHRQHSTADCPNYTFMFSKLDSAGGIGTFFKVQSIILMVVYSILFVREFLTIICFLIFVISWTSLLAAITVVLSAQQILMERTLKIQRKLVAKGELTPQEARVGLRAILSHDLATLFKKWFQISSAMIWKQANGKESAGKNRPSLSFYLVPFINIWIFCFRTTMQFLCLLLFDWSPPVGFPPLTVPLSLKLETTYKRSPTRQRLLDQIINFYESPLINYAIYASNVACIGFSIISVELTLVWNNITNIYDIRSTGQLIPFIIGIVGLLRVLYGISVINSAIKSTDTILSLLDFEPPEKIPNVDSRLGTPTESNKSALSTDPEPEPVPEITQTLGDGTEAVFWGRKPPHRHSIDIIRPEHILMDQGPQALGELLKFPRIPERERHLWWLNNYQELKDHYGRRGLKHYRTQAGVEFAIVKDFRFPLRQRWENNDITSGWSTPTPSEYLDYDPRVDDNPIRRTSHSIQRHTEHGSSPGSRMIQDDQRNAEHRKEPPSRASQDTTRSRRTSASSDVSLHESLNSRVSQDLRLGQRQDTNKCDEGQQGRNGDMQNDEFGRYALIGTHNRSRSPSLGSIHNNTSGLIHRAGRGRSSSGVIEPSPRSRSLSPRTVSDDSSSESIYLEEIRPHIILSPLLRAVGTMLIPCHRFLAWARNSPRCINAWQILRKQVWSHFIDWAEMMRRQHGIELGTDLIGLFKNMDDPDGSRTILPHCRLKPVSPTTRADLGEAFSKRSIDKLVPATLDFARTFLADRGMIESARMMESFGSLFEFAKGIRERRRDSTRADHIGRTMQHQLLVNQWHGIIPDEGFWVTLNKESKAKVKTVYRKKWKIKRTQSDLTRRMSWSVGDNYRASNSDNLDLLSDSVREIPVVDHDE